MFIIDSLGNIQEKEWENGEWKVSPVIPGQLICHLKEAVEISDDFTLRSYFEMIKKNPELQLLDPFFKDYISEYDKVKDKENDESEVHYLRLKRYVEYTDYDVPYIKPSGDRLVIDGLDMEGDEDKIKNTPKEQRNIDISWDFSGIGEYEGEITGVAIEFTPIERILNKSLKIEEDCKITINTEDFRNPIVRIGSGNISLFEFVTEIIWELSFAGTPEQRDDQFKEIMTSVDECKKEFSGEPI
jgi:hypothetical protein